MTTRFLTARAACDVLGISRTRGELKLMVKALSLHPRGNAYAGNLRLDCADWCLRHWHKYTTECGRRRDQKLTTNQHRG